MVHVLEHEIPDMDPEQINRNVMDRIYRDFPWLVEETSKSRAVSRVFRKRLTLMIAGFWRCLYALRLFCGNRQSAGASSGSGNDRDHPNGVADTAQTLNSQDEYKIPKPTAALLILLWLI